MKRMNRVLALLTALVALMACLPSALADTDLPYDTYNYDYWEDIQFTPAAYVPNSTLSGADYTWQGNPVGVFRTPQDLSVAPDGTIWVADTGNNRIVVISADRSKVVNIIDSFERDGERQTFSAPYSVCVSQNDQIYIADSQNHRIVVLEMDGSLCKIVENPESEVLDAGFVFTPLRVSVDYADRIYCIAQNMFEGIMVFESAGNFTGFFGTINVKISLWEKFWRKIATKEERSKQQLFIPTEFTGIDIDDEGFVYASNVDSDGLQAVRRLNPKGEDVIRKGPNQNVGGDLWINSTSTYGGPSRIIDVVYRDHGIYSLLDAKRGRIFTYDHEGNLLYIFGGLGTQSGTFTTPVAIEQSGNMIMVLDAYRASILLFKATDYGQLINDAVSLRYDGDEEQAVEKWQQVLLMDENDELANSGIGKAYLTAGNNELAMLYLKRGMNRDYYSVAFKRYRNELIKDNLQYILTGVLVLIALIVVITKLRKRSKARKGAQS